MREITLIVDESKKNTKLDEHIIGAFDVNIPNKEILKFILDKYDKPVRDKKADIYSIRIATEKNYTISKNRISLKNAHINHSVEINPVSIFLPVIGRVNIKDFYEN